MWAVFRFQNPKSSVISLGSKPKVFRNLLLYLLLNSGSVSRPQIRFVQSDVPFYLLQDSVVDVVCERGVRETLLQLLYQVIGLRGNVSSTPVPSEKLDLIKILSSSESKDGFSDQRIA